VQQQWRMRTFRHLSDDKLFDTGPLFFLAMGAGFHVI